MPLRSAMLALAALTLLFAAPAHAVVTTPLQGTISLVDATLGTSGVAVGLSFTGSVTYDETAIATVGPSVIELDGSNPAVAPGSLTLNLGGLTLTGSQDDAFGFGFPSINFQDGIFAGIDFTVTGIDLFGLTNASLQTDAFTRQLFVRDANSLVAVQADLQLVPLPAGILALAPALAGLVLAARRRAAA